MAAIQKSNNPCSPAFMLASVIIMSTALLVIGLAIVQLVVSNNQAVVRGMYAQVAQTAAKSGIDYAKEQFVSTGAYDGTGETTVIQNGRYRVTFTVTVLSTTTDGLRKDVESVGRLYLPELSATQFLVRSVRSDIIRTSATSLTPNQLSPMAWYDGADNATMHKNATTVNWTHFNTDAADYLNERTSNGTQTNGSWNSSWVGLGTNSLLGTVYTGTLFDMSSVPKGATITSAFIKFSPQGTASGTSNIRINGLAPSAVPVSNSFSGPPAANQLRNQPTVGPTVNWGLTAWPDGNQDQFTPDIKGIVQVVLDDASFNPATNYIGFRFQRSSGSSNHRVDKAEASLIVNYTTPGSTAVNDGDLVATWDDKSGNGRHLVAPAGREPTFRLNQQNGRGAVDFPYSGGTSGKYLSTASFNLPSTAQAGTIFAVSKSSDGSGDSASLVRMTGTINESNCVAGSPCTTRIYEIARDGTSSDGKFYVERSGVGGTSSLNVGTNNVFMGGAPATMLTGGVAFAVDSCNPGMSTASVDIARDRFTTVNCPSSGSYPKSFRNGLVIRVANGRNDARFSGQLAEVVMYNRQLSCQEVQSIQKYLRQKWFNDISDTNIISCPVVSAPSF